MRWLLLTGELPPHCGGVGDYTALVATALASAGDAVSVCVPRTAVAAATLPGVEIVTLPDRFGSGARRRLDALLDTARYEVLLQYVPQVLGCRGANLALCRWMRRRVATRGDSVRLMVHEPYCYWGWTRPHRNVLALVQRVMLRTLLRSAREVLVSTDAWHSYLAPYSPPESRAPMVLPVPSAVPRCDLDPGALRARRDSLSRGGPLVGHFGTYGNHIAPLLHDRLMRLLDAEPSVHGVCAGAGSEAFVARLGARFPRVAARLHATGRRPAAEVAATLASCDALLQPYPDGVTTRRTSVMAGLVNGRPVVTTSGPLTEPVWTSTRAVALAPAASPGTFVDLVRELLHDERARLALGARGEAAYRAHFALAQTVARLRRGAAGAAA